MKVELRSETWSSNMQLCKLIQQHWNSWKLTTVA